MKHKVAILIIIGTFLFTNFIQGAGLNKVKAYDTTILNEKFYANKYQSYSPAIAETSIITSQVYTDIYNAIKNVDDKVDLTKYNITSADGVWGPLEAVLEDHPELFYFSYSGTSLSGLSTSTGDVFTELTLGYSYPKDECLQKLSILENKVSSILSVTIASTMTDLEKEINIHDYIVQNTTYDEVNYNNNTVPEDDYNVWGTLIKGIGVCDGYSKAMKLLLNRTGIESIRVISEQMNHAWNLVKINGKYYHVDATWDDPVPETNRGSYYYFNITDDEISDASHKHIWDKTKYPASTDTSYDYLMKLGYSYGYYRANNKIYYYSSSDNTLNVMNLDGTNKEIAYNHFYGYYPAVFGQMLYYSNYYDGGNLYKLNLQGGQPEKVLDDRAYTIYIKDGTLHAGLSPDDRSIEYTFNLAQKEDLNADGITDIKDLAVIAQLYNQRKSNLGSSWNEKYDLKYDEIIDIYDLVLVAAKIA